MNQRDRLPERSAPHRVNRKSFGEAVQRDGFAGFQIRHIDFAGHDAINELAPAPAAGAPVHRRDAFRVILFRHGFAMELANSTLMRAAWRALRPAVFKIDSAGIGGASLDISWIPAGLRLPETASAHERHGIGCRPRPLVKMIKAAQMRRRQMERDAKMMEPGTAASELPQSFDPSPQLLLPAAGLLFIRHIKTLSC